MFYDINGEREKLHVPTAAVSDDKFRVFCKVSHEAVDIMVADQIGDDGWGGGVSADEIGQTLAANPTAPVNVRINSPGGLAYDGLKIYNMLANHEGHVTTINEGLAYSAASIIFMAGDTRQVYEASDFGIHRAAGGGYGNQYHMLALAEFLDGLDNHMISIYSQGSGQSEEQIKMWIDGETKGTMGTMFSGSEAVAGGFADSMIPNKSRAKSAASKVTKQAASLAVRAMIADRKAIAKAYSA